MVRRGVVLRVVLTMLIVQCAHRSLTAQQGLRVRIVSPQNGEIVAGKTPINVEVDGAVGDVKASFYIDGRLVFADATAPYGYAWDAGPKPSGKIIRVVATAADGRTAEATIRTAGIDSTEDVEVKLRQISVTVLDGKGDFVKDLEESNFQVFEDGARKEITHFYKGDAPLSLILMLDVSKSMLTGMRIEKSKKAAIEFLESLRPKDNIMTIAFNHGVYPLGDFTVDRASLERSIAGLVADGGTCLYDTLIATARKLNERHGRKVIVVFSDGRDEHSTANLADATDALMRGDSTLYAVGLGLLSQEKNQRQILEDWAKQSGGRAFFTDDVEQVRSFYAAISEELRWQYSIGFPPSASQRSWHEVRVNVTGRSGLRVRARTGYLSD
ncbi:MAG: VWA domain-containing protein [Acidobacteria bacterium]|nr:VWA domain-containing protein [Acidobacteriota bacterium]